MSTEPQIKRYMRRISRNDACEAGKAIAPFVYKYLNEIVPVDTFAILVIVAGRAALESKAEVIEGVKFESGVASWEGANGESRSWRIEQFNAQWQEMA